MDATGKFRPLWISHRGYHRNFTENTLDAFRAAVDLGFTALETDLRTTKDNHVVLIHDSCLKRLAGLSSRVEHMTRRQLQKIDFKGGGRPAFLDDFLQEFSQYELTFDIKPEQAVRTIQNLKSIIESSGLHDWVRSNVKFLIWHKRDEKLIQSYFPKSRFYARKAECWRAGLAVMLKFPLLSGIKRHKTYALTARVGKTNLFRSQVIDCYHRRQAKVVAFLPETVEDISSAVESGVDEVLLNGAIPA